MDFKKISKDGEDFEFFCRDLLESIGCTILSHPSRGPDGKKDILIEIESSNPLDKKERTTYLVQCKHNAHSGKSVLEKDIGDFRSACRNHGAGGYFLICSTIPSVTVSNNLASENTEGDFKTLIWDKRKLQQKVESSPEFEEIGKRFGLLENVEVTFSQLKKVMLSESGFPYDFKEAIDNDKWKGLIFKKVILNNEFQEKTILAGYFCMLGSDAASQVKEITEEFCLDNLILVSNQETNEKSVYSINGIYNMLQNYRDEKYQELLWQSFNSASIPLNPNAILFLSNIAKIPYKVQEVTIENLRKILAYPKDDGRALFIYEAINTIGKFKLKIFETELLNMLSKVEDWEIEKIKKILLISALSGALAVIYDSETSSIEKIVNIFKRSNSPQTKFGITRFFIDAKVRDPSGAVETFLKNVQDNELLATLHLIGYSPTGVHVVPNRAPANAHLELDKYQNIQ